MDKMSYFDEAAKKLINDLRNNGLDKEVIKQAFINVSMDTIHDTLVQEEAWNSITEYDSNELIRN